MKYEIFMRFVAVVTIITGLSVGATAFMSASMSEVWYVVLAYFMAGCTVSTGIVLFITAKFEEVK